MIKIFDKIQIFSIKKSLPLPLIFKRNNNYLNNGRFTLTAQFWYCSAHRRR